MAIKLWKKEVIHELTDRARQHFSTRKNKPTTFWIFEEPTTGALFEGGLVSENKAITFEINAKTLEVFEKNEVIL